MEQVEERTLTDINTVLEFAKLETTDVKPTVQCIYFSENLDNQAIKLLEVNDTVLESLTNGESLVIRGSSEDMAVLCTDKYTFEIKEAEISNSMLIVPELDVGQDVCDEGPQKAQISKVTSVVHNYYELRPVKPRVRKMKELLEENMFSGRECEEDEQHQGHKYSFEDLLNIVQASEHEIREALKKLQACQIEGYWRVLDFDFLTQVLNHIIQLCEENDWLSSGIPLEDCCQTLQELFPRDVIMHVIQCYADEMKSTVENDDGDDTPMHIDAKFYSLNEDKVCQFFAELVLRNSGKFNLKEFLRVWEQTVPQGMKTSLSQLEGMALIDRTCIPEVIWYFPVLDLPEEIGERFNVLFKTREKWTLEEITPFVKDLTTNKVDVGALLTKHSRASMANGIKVFGSRKPVT